MEQYNSSELEKDIPAEKVNEQRGITVDIRDLAVSKPLFNYFKKLQMKIDNKENDPPKKLLEEISTTYEEVKNEHLPSKINEIRKRKSYSPNSDNFDEGDLIKFIDYYRKRLDYWDFDFQLKPSDCYENFAEFTSHLNSQAYTISFQDIPKSYIDLCVEKGELYLFQIYSKDFSDYSKGKPNLQTLYWNALFNKENLKDVVYKLNGQAEIFHRKASIEYSAEIWKEGHHANEAAKKQKYPIIRNKRYTKDTYLFHTSITANFQATSTYKFNKKVNKFLSKNPDINILGIDRGERHLAYYTLINRKGEILKDTEGNYLQGSLNTPLGKKDYHKLLDTREKKRDEARKSWGTIEKIKDLKAGYLSQVVHRITKLMVDHNAIVVFEDLNFGFKRGRFKVEKQVYQKLEKMLIDKLNYLVFKDKEQNETGGLFKALQLTASFESFKKMDKQTGFIFYVPAYHTSKVCPTTGFVNLLYPRYETVKTSKEFFQKFESVRFNKDKNHFEFEFDYSNFTKKAEGSKQDWVLCTHGTRLENFRNKEKDSHWDTKKITLTPELKELLENYDIDYKDGNCIKNSIDKQDESQFFITLLRLLRLTLQMRNSRINSEEDWMISPVADEEGNFFDSRTVDENKPKNADANGAYHIALKGLYVKQQIDDWDKDKKPDISIANKDWYTFIQEKKYKKN